MAGSCYFGYTQLIDLRIEAVREEFIPSALEAEPAARTAGEQTAEFSNPKHAAQWWVHVQIERTAEAPEPKLPATLADHGFPGH